MSEYTGATPIDTIFLPVKNTKHQRVNSFLKKFVWRVAASLAKALSLNMNKEIKGIKYLEEDMFLSLLRVVTK